MELYLSGSYTLLSEADYNGDGQRVALTTYALGVGQTITYLNSSDGVLVADDGTSQTLYLYGQTQIAEFRVALPLKRQQRQRPSECQ